MWNESCFRFLASKFYWVLGETEVFSLDWEIWVLLNQAINLGFLFCFVFQVAFFSDFRENRTKPFCFGIYLRRLMKAKQLFFFWSKATHTFKESDGDPVAVSVHPGGDYFVCSTSKGGCKYVSISHTMFLILLCWYCQCMIYSRSCHDN